MRSAALKKQDQFEEAPESWDAFRRRVAREAEEACNLPGNNNATDFEEFALKYRLKKSDFV